MKLLILGGTRFLGRHLVETAVARGHAVTLFNRGRSAPQLFADLRQVHGDRDGGLDALLTGPTREAWDAVIDTCGFVPRVVGQSVRALAPWASRYVFVSSVSVYQDEMRPHQDERARVATLVDPAGEDVMAAYGALKAACEVVVRSTFGADALIVRPGLIVGPHDPTGRFAYWIERILRGGTMLAPDVPDYPVQVIDVRDLADWIIAALERTVVGTYNAVGPQEPLTLAGFFAACARVTGARPDVQWVGTEFLAGQSVQPWTDLPLWAGSDSVGIGTIDHRRALAAGLSMRPIESTLRDTLTWLGSIEAKSDGIRNAGLTAEREAVVLDAWARANRR